jgi:hypothetical protein
MRRQIAVDLAAAFVLSLLGGYCFACLWRATAFATKRAEGHHLYFRAALCGAMLFAFALCIRTLLASDSLAYLNFDSALVEYVRPFLKAQSGLAWIAQGRRAEWVVTAVYSLLLGIGGGVLANMFTPRRWALRRSFSAFDALLLRAHLEGIPVSLTSEDRQSLYRLGRNLPQSNTRTRGCNVVADAQWQPRCRRPTNSHH